MSEATSDAEHESHPSRAQAKLARPGLARWVVEHPIATVLLTAGAVLIGILAFTRLPVSPLPEADLPTIQIAAALPGASPETMASAVATPLEVQLSGVPGISEMSSSSALGTTSITLQFTLDKNIDVAAQEVQAAINTAASRLPRDMPSPPTWRKQNPNDSPVLVLRMNSPLLPITQLSDLAETVLARRISQIQGVSEVAIAGQQRPALRIQASPEKLAAFGLTLADIRTAIQQTSVNQPTGALFGEQSVSTLTTNNQLFEPEAYAKLVVAYRNGAPVLLGDVARASVGPENAYVQAWPNGEPGVNLIVRRQPGANIVATADRIVAALPQLRTLLPEGVELEILNDRTRTIRSSLHEVELTLGLTIGLVVLVMGLFLRQWSATAIVATVLCVALTATAAAMYALGFSLNNLTLVALIVSVGFVVDDAIVVVENIHRHLENGKSMLRAAIDGTSEIGFTVVSISVSLIAAFIPLLFMGGVVGRLFHEFALTVTAAILLSVAASLTLGPMLASRFMKPMAHAAQAKPGVSEKLLALYDRALQAALRHQGMTLAAFGLALAAAVASYVLVPKGFFPLQDTAFVVGVTQAAEDIPYAQMAEKHRRLAEVIERDPAVQGYTHAIGQTGGSQSLSSGRFWVVLKDRSDRDVSSEGFIDRLRAPLAQVPGIQLFMRSAQDINLGAGSSRAQYQYTLRGNDSTELAQWADRLGARLQQAPGLRDVSSDLQMGASRTQVEIDRTAAARFGLSTSDIAQVLYDAFGQRQVSQFQTELNQYYVILEIDERQRGMAESLQYFHLRAPATGAMVALAEVARVAPPCGGAGHHPARRHVAGGEPFVQPAARSLARRGRRRGACGRSRDRPARRDLGDLPRQRAGLPGLARQSAAAHPRGGAGGLHHPRRAVRELRAPADHPLDTAFGRHRRDRGARRAGARLLDHGDDRRGAADRHRQEERHPGGRLRARAAAQRRLDAARGGVSRLPGALSADHDDDLGGAAGRHPAGAGLRHRRGAAPAAWNRGGGRPAGQPGAHALHHPRRLSHPRPPADAARTCRAARARSRAGRLC